MILKSHMQNSESKSINFFLKFMTFLALIALEFVYSVVADLKAILLV